jgi:hypothetical protein
VDSLKVLDPNRPIREATGQRTSRLVRFVPKPEVEARVTPVRAFDVRA